MKETKTYQESAEEYADSFFDSQSDVDLFRTLAIMRVYADLEDPEADTNNYLTNVLLINVGENDMLTVETAFRNEYNCIYGNNDHKVFNYPIEGTCVGDFIHLYDNNKMVVYR